MSRQFGVRINGMDAWTRADTNDLERTLRAEGIGYLLTEFDGVRWIAPLGTQVPPKMIHVTVAPRGLKAAT